jgi:hypothetical protein
VILIEIYVDDCLVIATDEGIDNIINNLRYCDFGLEIDHNLTYYLNYRIHDDYNQNNIFDATSFDKEFGEEVNNLRLNM